MYPDRKGAERMTTNLKGKPSRSESSGRSKHYRQENRGELAEVRSPNAFVLARLTYGSIS
jgi:hypothetical protein